MNETKWREVPFEIMLKCDGEIKCEHWLLSNKFKTKPILFNEFLQQIGKYLTSMNCQSLFQHAKWYVIDDGVQPDFFMKPPKENRPKGMVITENFKYDIK